MNMMSGLRKLLERHMYERWYGHVGHVGSMVHVRLVKKTCFIMVVVAKKKR